MKLINIEYKYYINRYLNSIRSVLGEQKQCESLSEEGKVVGCCANEKFREREEAEKMAARCSLKPPTPTATQNCKLENHKI